MAMHGPFRGGRSKRVISLLPTYVPSPTEKDEEEEEDDVAENYWSVTADYGESYYSVTADDEEMEMEAEHPWSVTAEDEDADEDDGEMDEEEEREIFFARLTEDVNHATAWAAKPPQSHIYKFLDEFFPVKDGT